MTGHRTPPTIWKEPTKILPSNPVQQWSGTEVGVFHSICHTPMLQCKKNLSKAISKEGYTIFWSPFGILKFDPDLMGWFLPIDVSFRAEIYPTEPLLLRKKSRCFHVFDRTCIMNKWAMLLMQFFSKNVMTWGRTNCNGMTPPRLLLSMSWSHLDRTGSLQRITVFCPDHILDLLKREFFLDPF